MTDKEKAKAYDEAIRKAKITLDCCNSASITTKNTIYNIFPELAESEDERIRKEIISALNFANHKDVYDKHLDWLKSLKERNTWKPSYEQIIALRWVLNNIPYNKHKEEISGLLDQIKDL